MDQVLTFFGRESNTAGNYTGHILSCVRIRGGRIFAAWFVHGISIKIAKVGFFHSELLGISIWCFSTPHKEKA